MVMELHLGQLLTLKKPHPCGGSRWRVERLGADIGVRCLRCDHYVLVPRSKLERQVRSPGPFARAEDGRLPSPMPDAGPARGVHPKGRGRVL